MKIDLKTALTIGAMVVSVTVSHMNLKGRIDVLEATNRINHDNIMVKLGEIKTAMTGEIYDNYAGEPAAKKRRKKIYAVDDFGLYMEQEIEAY